MGDWGEAYGAGGDGFKLSLGAEGEKSEDGGESVELHCDCWKVGGSSFQSGLDVVKLCLCDE